MFNLRKEANLSSENLCFVRNNINTLIPCNIFSMTAQALRAETNAELQANSTLPIFLAIDLLCNISNNCTCRHKYLLHYDAPATCFGPYSPSEGK